MTGHNLALPLLLSVSDVTRLIRESLEEQFQDVWIEGEISNLRAPSSGHLYFTLKDSQSQLRGVLFRSGALRLRFALQEGLSVIARGRISVYEPRGEYQLIVDSLDPKGVGAFQLAFEQLKERLSQEGLFDEARKRRLPSFPSTVGVVTADRCSDSGYCSRASPPLPHRQYSHCPGSCSGRRRRGVHCRGDRRLE